MNSIVRFVKSELSGWNKKEVVSLFVIFSLVIYNKTILQDSSIAIISAVCGLLYTMFAGKGKLSCYLFGLTGSSFYAYLSFKHLLWGNMLLYLLYYVPMQIVGIFRWKKNLNPETLEIYKTSLSKCERNMLFVTTMTVSVLVYYILTLNGDSQPFFDSVTTVFSLLGMYLTVKRCIEQWMIWSIVNFICVVMWLNILFSGAKVYSTVLMWLSYFFLGIYFYFNWRKELTISK